MATPESELIMFGEAVATPIQNSSSTSNTNTSMSGIETPVPKGHASYEYHQAINHVDACQNTVEENQTLHVTDARVTWAWLTSQIAAEYGFYSLISIRYLTETKNNTATITVSSRQ